MCAIILLIIWWWWLLIVKPHTIIKLMHVRARVDNSPWSSGSFLFTVTIYCLSFKITFNFQNVPSQPSILRLHTAARDWCTFSRVAPSKLFFYFLCFVVLERDVAWFLFFFSASIVARERDNYYHYYSSYGCCLQVLRQLHFVFIYFCIYFTYVCASIV